jgi:hypothetical protein
VLACTGGAPGGRARLACRRLHDGLLCQRTPETQAFIWDVHESGTHIIRPDQRDGSGNRAPVFPAFIDAAFEDMRFFSSDGVSLRPLAGPEAARSFLLQHAPAASRAA